MSPRADVLVVDDSDSDAELTTLALQRARPELALLRACDGAEALQLLSAEAAQTHPEGAVPRLMLLDCNMPVLNGLETLQALRQSPLGFDVTVILFSSITDPAVRRKALELGASDYIVKPLSFSGYCVHMKAIVDRWLDAADRPTTSRLAAAAV
jgi:CheY-like chemotaxis protein